KKNQHPLPYLPISPTEPPPRSNGHATVRQRRRRAHRPPQLPNKSPPPRLPLSFHVSPRSSHVRAPRGLASSRTRRLEKRTKKGDEDREEDPGEEAAGASSPPPPPFEVGGGGGGGGDIEYSKEPMPKLEGLEPDFWEGPQWNAFGFFVQYMWAFGILFGLISGGIAAATYNEGAADFKQTPAYKESIQSRELLEEPDASNADVFEANPTETAPSLE
ncbi:uncharacterized protein LOC109833739, partial [Asparagus officinalis]|uniref:uncharacterized protein LOC109833739 n=1 Tax=Asparagus officinalis TaxID=4686 RepID=UPI00098DE713